MFTYVHELVYNGRMDSESDTAMARAVYFRIVTLLLLTGETKMPGEKARILNEVRDLAAYFDTLIAGRTCPDVGER